jgi:putative Holliday junction resolvase
MRAGVRLGVDVGSVRVGVAVSDPSGLLAIPVATVAAAEPEGVAQLVEENAAVEVIVGLPRTLAGREGPSAQAARDYARRLAVRIAPVPVRLHDERLTTVDAHRNLRASGVGGREHRAVIDQAAAVLILQGALDAERSSGRPPGELVRPDRRKPRKKDRDR